LQEYANSSRGAEEIMEFYEIRQGVTTVYDKLKQLGDSL
jgi:hypothetical protein